MDIRVLEYFLTVAREESITAAAQALHMTQPPLSRQMRELEEELGKTLFIRGKRKISLTEDGMILRKRASEIIELFEKTKTEISTSHNEISGTVDIGVPESEGMRIIAKTIKEVNDNYPKIDFQIFSSNSFDTIERLDKGLIDFGILSEPVNLKKYNYLKLPYVNNWGILMRTDHPLAKNKSIQPADLLQYRLICSRQMLEEDGLSGWLGYDYKELNIVANYNLVNTPVLLAEEGVGAVITFNHLVNTSGDRNICFVPFEPQLESSLYIIWKKYQIFSSASDIFLNTLQNQMLSQSHEHDQSI